MATGPRYSRRKRRHVTDDRTEDGPNFPIHDSQPGFPVTDFIFIAVATNELQNFPALSQSPTMRPIRCGPIDSRSRGLLGGSCGVRPTGCTHARVITVRSFPSLATTYTNGGSLALRPTRNDSIATVVTRHFASGKCIG